MNLTWFIGRALCKLHGSIPDYTCYIYKMVYKTNKWKVGILWKKKDLCIMSQNILPKNIKYLIAFLSHVMAGWGMDGSKQLHRPIDGQI